ncbi:MAG: DUF4157 domain-containing protein [Thermoanaerobaculia bacterium]
MRERLHQGSTSATFAAKAAFRSREGEPLDAHTRASMESRFGHDFGSVRIHADGAAARAASSMEARAFTIGHDIGFALDAHAPHTEGGRELLAHELEHVVEQSRGVTAGVQLAQDPQKRAKDMVAELEQLIAEAVWKGGPLRKRLYAEQSVEGLKISKKRKTGAMPELTGMGTIKAMERFVTTLRGIQTLWPKISDKQRTKQVGDAIGGELEKAEVPRFLQFKQEPMPGMGFFLPSEWSYTVNEDLMNRPSLSDEDAEELGNVSYHEARHAEQHFVAARYGAGIVKQDAKTIANEHGVHKDIAAKAVAKKFDVNTDPALLKFGEAMFSAHVTNDDKNQKTSDLSHEAITDLPKKRVAAMAALQKLRNNLTDAGIREATPARDALRDQIKLIEERYPKYRAIPYEADAHEVGNAVGLAFRNWQ